MGSQRRSLEFGVGDKVFLKVFPYIGRLQFRNRGKLSPRNVGTFEIRRRVGQLEYHFPLTLEYRVLHDVFYISMLKNYHHNPSHIIPHSMVPIHVEMAYEEYPMKIID